jgi:hypothetical protein
MKGWNIKAKEKMRGKKIGKDEVDWIEGREGRDRIGEKG